MSSYNLNEVAFNIVNVVVMTAIKEKLLDLSSMPSETEAVYVIDKVFVAMHYSGCRGFISAVLNVNKPVGLEEAREIINKNPEIAIQALVAFIQQYFFT